VKIIILFLLALAPLHAQADTFRERVASAKHFLESSGGKVYEPWINSQVGPLITKTLQDCFVSLDAPDKSDFEVVADVLPTGKLSSVAARPRTDLAMCFVQGLEAAILSSPPGTRHRWPLYINL